MPPFPDHGLTLFGMINKEMRVNHFQIQSHCDLDIEPNDHKINKGFQYYT